VPWRVSVTFFSKNRPAGCSAKQKALVQMNIELSEVLTDVMGLSGQLIIRDIVAGERDPNGAGTPPPQPRQSKCTREITQALTGNWREEHLFVLRQSLGMYDDIARHLAECDTKLQAELKNLGEKKIDLGKPPRSGSKQRLEFDNRRILVN